MPSEVDGVVLDIGVSSMQLDEAERGFSFRTDGPLDMRMAQAGASAADVVNRFKAGDLDPHLRLPRRGAACRPHRPHDREAARRRGRSSARSTLPTRSRPMSAASPKDKIHPATRVFQALRIFVNDELGELAEALFAAERVLKPGGRLAVVTFHSLEDRIVKRFIADRSGKPAGSRHLPEDAGEGGDLREARRRDRADRRRDRGQSARALGQAAGCRSARPRRRAPPIFSIFGLPKLPEIQLSAER